MVESEAAAAVSEEQLCSAAVTYGHEQMQTAIDAINETGRREASIEPRWDWTAPQRDPETIDSQASRKLRPAILSRCLYQIADKMERRYAIAAAG